MSSDYVLNIINAYLMATDAEYDEGVNWYPHKRDLALEWANGDLWRGAGVIAAYSPLTPWWRNMELARDSLITGIARTDTITQSWTKAQAILDGAPVLETLRGPKLTAFATAIVDPATDLITVDSHAYSIAMGKHFFTRQVKMNMGTYRAIANAYIEAADYAGIDGTAMQAITWGSWRNRNFNKAARKGDIVQSLA